MKHCHFSILYNELPYLKQKVPFLYDNFDQLIFYDLSAFDGKYQFSQDGSHEYLKNYPDPQNKITLIELRNGLEFVQSLGGPTGITKQKMATYANKFINDDMDVFWTTDMDEFFTKDLMIEVEELLNEHPKVNCIENNHFLFWNDFNTIMCESVDKPEYKWGLARIARHKPGRQYSHCDLQTRHAPCFRATTPIYHFCNVGKEKTLNKLYNFYKGTPSNYREIWDKYETLEKEDGVLYGYPNMHQSIPNMGIMNTPFNVRGYLYYVDFTQLTKDIK